MSDLVLANSTYISGLLDSASTVQAGVDEIKAQHINGPTSAIVQIETVLGNGPALKGNTTDLATRLNQQMDPLGNLIPVGGIIPYGGATSPTGWLLCDGAAYSRITFANLFAVIGTTYGPGDNSTTFNVPDLRSRIPIGVGTGVGGGASGTGLPTGGVALGTIARGTWKGEDTHLLTGSESGLQSHAHTTVAHTHSEREETETSGSVAAAKFQRIITTGSDGTNFNDVVTAATGIVIQTGPASPNTNSAGPTNAASAHNNIQPVLGVNYIIRI